MTQMLLWMTIAFSWMTLGQACSCTGHRDKDYCGYDIVFRGKAVAEYQEKSEYWDETDDFDPHGMRVYTFQVTEIFWSKKSSDAMTTVNVTTPNNEGFCGVEFNLNTDYIISADNDSGKLTTDLCSGNKNWNELRKKRKMFFTSGLRKLCA